MRKVFISGLIGVLVFGISCAWAQKTVRLSIATGGTGGVIYPYGGGMANIISKYIPYVEATAEVTNAVVDNSFLLDRGKVDLAMMMADVAWDAYMGKGPFREKIPMRAVAALWPNFYHVVTLEGKGIEKMTDLKGKRISTGAPGSGTEAMGLRILEAYGLDPDKDMTRDKLGATESAGALKDRKIDAFFWIGGLPTAGIMDLAATPGIKIKLIPHADAVDKMREKYGPLYVKAVLPAKTYPGQDVDVPDAVTWIMVVCHEKMKENIAYDIVKVLFEHKPELVAVHPVGKYLSLEAQAGGGSPIPFHSGAIRYYTEKGLKVK